MFHKYNNSNDIEFVKVTEFCNPPKTLERNLTNEEVHIIETQFNDKIEVVSTLGRQHAIKTMHYVGYIVLPHHVISILPKIPGISYFDMIRYALKLPELKPENFSVSDEGGDNYYDILVRFLLQELEVILQRGLYNSYVNYEDNLNCVHGKILFKEQITYNCNRRDKVFCSFSELTSDVLENNLKFM